MAEFHFSFGFLYCFNYHCREKHRAYHTLLFYTIPCFRLFGFLVLNSYNFVGCMDIAFITSNMFCCISLFYRFLHASFLFILSNASSRSESNKLGFVLFTASTGNIDTNRVGYFYNHTYNTSHCT